MCLLLALCLLAGSIAFADGSDQRTDLRVYLDGLLRGRAYLDNGKIYLSMESVSDFYSLGISAVFKDGELYFTGPNFDMYVNSDVGYTRVNGRYLYTPDGYFRSGGQISLPLEVLARIFGFEYSVPEDDQPRVELQRGELNVLQGGDNYYDINFVSEDIFWLSRIIRAEAQNEPLSCMIGVGNSFSTAWRATSIRTMCSTSYLTRSTANSLSRSATAPFMPTRPRRPSSRPILCSRATTRSAAACTSSIRSSRTTHGSARISSSAARSA